MKPARDGMFVALAVLLIGIVIGWQTTNIPSEAAYAQVGPSVVPWLLTAMFVLLAVVIMLQTILGTWQSGVDPAPLHLVSLSWVAAGLLINLFAIEHVGFILASTALFVCTARAFGSKHPWRDAPVGFLLALTAYAGFDRLLGYEIGTGLIENLI